MRRIHLNPPPRNRRPLWGKNLGKTPYRDTGIFSQKKCDLRNHIRRPQAFYFGGGGGVSTKSTVNTANSIVKYVSILFDTLQHQPLVILSRNFTTNTIGISSVQVSGSVGLRVEDCRRHFEYKKHNSPWIGKRIDEGAGSNTCSFIQILSIDVRARKENVRLFTFVFYRGQCYFNDPRSLSLLSVLRSLRAMHI